MGVLQQELVEVQRLLAVYKERLHLLNIKSPVLALVALAEVGQYDIYHCHFKRKIWQLEHEKELLIAKIGLENYRELWAGMDEIARESSFVQDQIMDIKGIITELEQPCGQDGSYVE